MSNYEISRLKAIVYMICTKDKSVFEKAYKIAMKDDNGTTCWWYMYDDNSHW